MKKKHILFLILVLLLPKGVGETSISAQYACVMEAQTGQVLYEKNAYSRHSMASTTKIMTALVAIEEGNLNDLVTVSKNAAGTEGTSLYLKAGDEVLLSDLLYGLMLQSGNDAAIAIAEHICGSVEAFAEKMTQRAKAIGAENTAFQNPNGLDADGHYTTAYDLALITRAALKNETFAEICATKSKAIRSGTQTIVNHNKLLANYPGCVGVKTGFTKKTGRCLVSSAVRDGRQIICVTLHAPNDWNDHTILLNQAFDSTLRYPLLAKGMTVNTISVSDGTSSSVEVAAEEDFYLTERKNTKFQNASIRLRLPRTLSAPISKGEVLGVAEIYYQDELLSTINLSAAADVFLEESSPTSDFCNFFKKLLYFSCAGPKSVIE